MRKFLLILICLLSIEKNRAQAVYVDVNPDSVISIVGCNCTKSSQWDLDNDGVNDFNFTLSIQPNSGGTNYISIVPLSNNSVLDSSVQLGEVINNKTNWLSYSCVLEGVSISGYYGSWHLNVDSFAGVKFYSGTNLYYGWMRLATFVSQGEARIIIKDYAYSNSIITAGEEMTNSIKNVKLDLTTYFYPNPTTNNLQITCNNLQPTQIQISDILGNEFIEIIMQKGKSNIDVSSLANGVYFIKTNNGMQKFIKQ
ncbi:MAG: T9SS type A sorting domain-containing protein [Bacteroidia bacterium]